MEKTASLSHVKVFSFLFYEGNAIRSPYYARMLICSVRAMTISIMIFVVVLTNCIHKYINEYNQDNRRGIKVQYAYSILDVSSTGFIGKANATISIYFDIFIGIYFCFEIPFFSFLFLLCDKKIVENTQMQSSINM